MSFSGSSKSKSNAKRSVTRWTVAAAAVEAAEVVAVVAVSRVLDWIYRLESP